MKRPLSKLTCATVLDSVPKAVVNDCISAMTCEGVAWTTRGGLTAAPATSDNEAVNRVITLVNFIELVLNRDRDEELLEGIGTHPRFL
jgi:hypothetical protein